MWGDDRTDDGAVTDAVLYSLVDQQTAAALADFADTINAACAAAEKAIEDVKRELAAIVESLKDGEPPAGRDSASALPDYDKLAGIYNYSQAQFIKLTRGLLVLLKTTEIKQSLGDNKSALARYSELQEITETTRRFKSRARVMLTSGKPERRAKAVLAEELSARVEIEYFRRMTCVFGPPVAVGGGGWRDAEAWARKHAGDAAVVERLRRCLTAALKHKRSIDWERDSAWAYSSPRE